MRPPELPAGWRASGPAPAAEPLSPAAPPGAAVAAATPRTRRAGGVAVAGALFAALVALGVLPIWIVAHVPTQDGANHVESVMALLRLPGSPLLQRHFLPNYGPQPNWLTQAAFAALVQAFSPRIAEKLILSGYLVLLPLAFRFALPATPRGRWAALTIFPFLHGYAFHMGFWNFCYSLALFFVALGIWSRTRGRLRGGRAAAFALAGLALFAAHSVSTAAALAAFASILAWRCGLALWRARGRAARRRAVLHGYLRRAAGTALCWAPALALMAAFLVRQRKPAAFRPPLLDYAKHFATLHALVSFDRRELALTTAVALTVALGIGLVLRERARRRLRPADGWLAAALVSTALYFAMPDAAADGAQLNDRLALYPFFAALLWLGWSSARLDRVRAVALALVALFLAGTAARAAKYRQIDGYLAEYESVAPHVAEGSTLLPLTLSPFGPRAGGRLDGAKLLSHRVQAFQHAAGYVVTERRGVDLDNSQARTRHAPLRWRPEVDPFVLLDAKTNGLELEPPCVELWTYAALAGPIDYVLVWGDAGAAAQDECGRAVLAELSAGYRRIFVSKPRGLAQLWVPVGAPKAPVPARPAGAE